MPKLFFDTNILVSATFWEGCAYKLLFADDAIGYTSNAILKEYRRLVLMRDFGLSEEEIDVRLKKLLELLVIVSPSESLLVVKEDPDDDRVLEGAIEAKADFIVSYDNHLLKLKSFRSIRIVKPEEVLNLFQSKQF